MCVAAGSASGYERSKVQAIGSFLSMSDDGETVALQVQEAVEWVPGATVTVLVDLKSGRDLAWWPGHKQVLLSPDNRYAVLFSPGRPCLPGPEGRPVIREGLPVIWDVVRHQELERLDFDPVGTGAAGPAGDPYEMRWSPRSDWLAVVKQTHGGSTYEGALLTLRPDGSERRELELWKHHQYVRKGEYREAFSYTVFTDWAWVPGGDAIYLLERSGEVLRYCPADGSRSPVLRRPGDFARGSWEHQNHRLVPSPDGRRLAICRLEIAPGQTRTGLMRTWVYRLDEPQATLEAEMTQNDIFFTRLIWSKDGRTLYAGSRLRWQVGQKEPTVMKLPADIVQGGNISVLPVGDAALVSVCCLVDAQGNARPLSAVFPQFSPDDRVAGVDSQDRLVVLQREPVGLALLDPQTGALKHVYP
jgi:hypothetical protein